MLQLPTTKICNDIVILNVQLYEYTNRWLKGDHGTYAHSRQEKRFVSDNII